MLMITASRKPLVSTNMAVKCTLNNSHSVRSALMLVEPCHHSVMALMVWSLAAICWLVGL